MGYLGLVSSSMCVLALALSRLALVWGRSRAFRPPPQRVPAVGEVLVAVTGASGPLWLCYAADPTAEQGCLQPAARRGENFASLPVPPLLSREERVSAADCRFSYLRAGCYTGQGLVVPACTPVFCVTRAPLCTLNTEVSLIKKSGSLINLDGHNLEAYVYKCCGMQGWS